MFYPVPAYGVPVPGLAFPPAMPAGPRIEQLNSPFGVYMGDPQFLNVISNAINAVPFKTFLLDIFNPVLLNTLTIFMTNFLGFSFYQVIYEVLKINKQIMVQIHEDKATKWVIMAFTCLRRISCILLTHAGYEHLIELKHLTDTCFANIDKYYGLTRGQGNITPQYVNALGDFTNKFVYYMADFISVPVGKIPVAVLSTQLSELIPLLVELLEAINFLQILLSIFADNKVSSDRNFLTNTFYRLLSSEDEIKAILADMTKIDIFRNLRASVGFVDLFGGTQELDNYLKDLLPARKLHLLNDQIDWRELNSFITTTEFL